MSTLTREQIAIELNHLTRCPADEVRADFLKAHDAAQREALERSEYRCQAHFDASTQRFERVQALEQQLADARAELAKWQAPFDKEQFEAAKQQASHKDSLAAQGVYITALEHALKHARKAVVELADMVIDEYECHEKSRLILSCCLIAHDDYQRALALKRASGAE